MATQVPASFTCANTSGDVEPNNPPCEKKATSICVQCHLVQYCSRACQKAHWALHKSDCKSPYMKPKWKPAWDTENRGPSFVEGGGGPAPNNGPNITVHGQRKYLWGNVPALDVLNLKDNEGVDTTRDFRLLFAASGDLRNAAKTVTGLPDSYAGQCELILNDLDADIVVRNALFLLVALNFEPKDAAPMILHLWYSVLIPSPMLKLLQEKIAPLIQDVCTKIKGKSEDCFQAKTWTHGTSSLRIVLKKSQWQTLLRYLQVPEDLSADKAQNLRRATSLAPERTDYLHRGLFSLSPTRRVGMMKFRNDGILLPFGASRKGFDTPNPTLFQSRKFWPMMDSADPLGGWSIHDVLGKVPLAKNDLYGGLYFHVHDLLFRFCERIKCMKLAFVLFQVNALELVDTFKECGLLKQGFDRVEVSNISDGGFIGIARVLIVLSPLLRLKPDNPHATLLTLFLNAVHEFQDEIPSPARMKFELARVAQYLPRPSAAEFMLMSNSAVMCDWMATRSFFLDFDGVFKRYMEELGFEKLARETGVCVKERHTLVEMWPFRLRDGAGKEEFEILHSSSFTGCERYVEWSRV